MATENLTPVRDQIIEFLKTLPEDTSLKDILYHLHVRSQIMEAQEEIRKGQYYTDEQALVMLKKWLK
jgi:hypothetical protein